MSSIQRNEVVWYNSSKTSVFSDVFESGNYSDWLDYNYYTKCRCCKKKLEHPTTIDSLAYCDYVCAVAGEL